MGAWAIGLAELLRESLLALGRIEAANDLQLTTIQAAIPSGKKAHQGAAQMLEHPCWRNPWLEKAREVVCKIAVTMVSGTSKT